MKALPSQFNNMGFSGAVATPTCSSCCCCCCCLATLTGGAVAVAQEVAIEASKSKNLKSRVIWAQVEAVLALPIAVGAGAAYLYSGGSANDYTVLFVVGVILFGLYCHAFSLVRSKQMLAKSVAFTIAIAVALVVEVVIGASLLASGVLMVLYPLFIILVIIFVNAKNKNRLQTRLSK